MDEVNNEGLFGLSINPGTKEHLSEAARWARFLALTGMVMLALLLLFVLLGGSFFLTSFSGGVPFGGAQFAFIFIWLIAAVALWFFPLLFTLRFANKMRAALATDDQVLLDTAFQNLKITFRYLGIVTIIIVALYALVFMFAIIGASMFS